MITKTIKYTDYNGNEREEKFYFNLTKAELTELNLELSSDGNSLQNKLQKMIDDKDIAGIFKFFKLIIVKSYGEKSEDGRRFIKTDDIGIGFTQTEAYSVLLEELLSAEDGSLAVEFVKRIMPQDTQK